MLRFRIKRAAELILFFGLAAAVAAAESLLNVSYDVTREFYSDYNAAFSAHWQQVSQATVTIQQSHGGSSAQMRAVIEGLPADVVTMNQTLDIDRLVEAPLIAPDWAARLPYNSVPYTSTILFVVRKGTQRISMIGPI